MQLLSNLEVAYSSQYSESAVCNLFERVNALKQKHDSRSLEMKNGKSWLIYLAKAKPEN